MKDADAEELDEVSEQLTIRLAGPSEEEGGEGEGRARE